MFRVPFRTQLSQVSPSDIEDDRFSVVGEPLSFTSSRCAALFYRQTSATHCPAACINTCPHLHPNNRSGIMQQIAQGEIILPYLDKAIEGANMAVTAQTVQVTVSGPVSFSVPSGASDSIVAIVKQRVEEELAFPSATPVFQVQFFIVLFLILPVRGRRSID